MTPPLIAPGFGKAKVSGCSPPINHMKKSAKLILVKLSAQRLKTFAWSLSALVSTVAVLAWGQLYDWGLSGLSIYQLFPLFGLLAFSLMWSHYIVAVVRLHGGIDSSVTKSYFEATSFVVLVSILLHPATCVAVVAGWRRLAARERNQLRASGSEVGSHSRLSLVVNLSSLRTKTPAEN